MDESVDFFLELDLLKLVERKTYINRGTRRENSAEHSWHLALACWSIAEQFKLNISQEKVIKLALIHDLGEIDAGDTFLYSSNRATANEDERNGVARIEALSGNHIPNLLSLWDEQEYGDSEEAKLLKAVDRLLPFMHNIASEGRAWKENNIKRSQVANAHQFISLSFPEIHGWISKQIEIATDLNWLIDDSE